MVLTCWFSLPPSAAASEPIDESKPASLPEQAEVTEQAEVEPPRKETGRYGASTVSHI